MLTSEYLIAAKAVISNPDNWTKGYYAMTRPIRDVNERNLDDYLEVGDPKAVCFCSMGALAKVAYGVSGSEWSYDKEIMAVFDQVTTILGETAGPASLTGVNDVVAFNDRRETTHEDVMALFDRAIASAKEMESLS